MIELLYQIMTLQKLPEFIQKLRIGAGRAVTAEHKIMHVRIKSLAEARQCLHRQHLFATLNMPNE